MTDDEFGTCMAVLAATWPHYDLPVETVRVWRASLGRYEANDMLQAVQWLAVNDDRFPSLHRCRERIQHEARRRAESLPALPGPAAPMGQWRRFLDLAREAASKEVRHDHHRGAEGCPTCSKHVRLGEDRG